MLYLVSVLKYSEKCDIYVGIRIRFSRSCFAWNENFFLRIEILLQRDEEGEKISQ